jgi:hypothetical protein
MRYLSLLAYATLIAAWVPAAGAQVSKPEAEVIVAPFIVKIDNGDALRAQADSCFEKFAAALTLNGVRVARDPQLSEKNLRSAAASWAVLGQLSRKDEQFQLELRLLEVESGEELRSYFNADKDLQAACLAVEQAADRIAAFVKEQRSHEN